MPTATTKSKTPAARKPARKQRRHGALPVGYVWREQPDGSGRPRWFATPTLRKAGWKGVDLRDAKGAWLGRGAAIEAATAINAAIADWKAGRPIPAAWAHIAPSASAKAQAETLDRFSIGMLFDAWVGAGDTPPAREFASKAPATQRDYRNKLLRLLDAISGFAALPPADDAKAETKRQAALAKLRGLSIMTLEPFEEDDGKLFDPLYEAYWALHAHAGINQASGVMAVASVWLSWIRKRQTRKVKNWAAEVSRETPSGRIRAATLAELQALVAAADAIDLPEVGDAIVLSFDLSWSQTDVLALAWPMIDQGRAFTGAGGRKKTGRVGGTPFTFIGLARLDQIRERQAAEKVTPLKSRKVIVLKRSRVRDKVEGADSHFIRKLFAKVREEAVRACPSCADLTFADLRDTAVTFGRNAGLNDDQLASRTLQSRKNIAELHDKHYGEIGPEIADQGRALLETYYRSTGITL